MSELDRFLNEYTNGNNGEKKEEIPYEHRKINAEFKETTRLIEKTLNRVYNTLKYAERSSFDGSSDYDPFKTRLFYAIYMELKEHNISDKDIIYAIGIMIKDPRAYSYIIDESRDSKVYHYYIPDHMRLYKLRVDRDDKRFNEMKNHNNRNRKAMSWDEMRKSNLKYEVFSTFVNLYKQNIRQNHKCMIYS